MKYLSIILVSTALAMSPASAEVEHIIHHHMKPVFHPGGPSPPNVAPLAATAGVMGCVTGGLMISAAIKGATEHRELTLREAHVMFWSCMIPVAGYFIAEAVWKANPQWNRYRGDETPY